MEEDNILCLGQFALWKRSLTSRRGEGTSSCSELTEDLPTKQADVIPSPLSTREDSAPQALAAAPKEVTLTDLTD